jgi:hypothetical protein
MTKECDNSTVDLWSPIERESCYGPAQLQTHAITAFQSINISHLRFIEPSAAFFLLHSEIVESSRSEF